MQKKPEVRKCLFCGATADSQEHVFAEWLTKRMRARNQKFQAAVFNGETGLKTYGWTTPGKYRTKQVCDDCNNGWMSQLEQDFQQKVGGLIEPDWPLLAEEMVQSLQDHSEMMVRWMIKTAIIFEKASPKGVRPVIPVEVRSMAIGKERTEDFFLAVANIQTADFMPNLSKGYPVWKNGIYNNHMVHRDGFSFAVHLNHLAIRLIRAPNSQAGIKMFRFAKDNKAKAPFWIIPKTINYEDPVDHSFPAFKLFMDSIQMVSGTSKNPIRST